MRSKVLYFFIKFVNIKTVNNSANAQGHIRGLKSVGRKNRNISKTENINDRYSLFFINQFELKVQR